MRRCFYCLFFFDTDVRSFKYQRQGISTPCVIPILVVWQICSLKLGDRDSNHKSKSECKVIPSSWRSIFNKRQSLPGPAPARWGLSLGLCQLGKRSHSIARIKTAYKNLRDR